MCRDCNVAALCHRLREGSTQDCSLKKLNDMFLEDKLEEIQAQDIPVLEKASQFLKAMTENMEKSVVVNKDGTIATANIVNTIKRIDATWQRFAQKYNYKVDFFRTHSADAVKKLGHDVYESLNW